MQRINLKRLFVMVLAMVMLFSVAVFSLERYDAAHYDDVEMVFVEDWLDDPVFSDYLMCQLRAEFGEQFLINHDIANEVADRVYDTFPVSRSGEIAYPDSFGGLYIDSDGNLVLLTVGDYQFDRSQAFGFCAEITSTDNISVRAVEFSYSELLYVFQAITAFAEEKWDDKSCVIMYGFVSVGIDTIGNRVDVALLDTSQFLLDLFRAEIADHPALTFTLAKERAGFDDEYVQDSYRTSEELIQPFSIVANPGSTIRRGAVGPRRSLGYRAWLGATAGFVTAAHNTLFNEPFYSSGRKIGYISVRHNASDSAFVRLEPGMSVSDRNPSFRYAVSPVAQTNPRVGHVVTRISSGGRDSGNPNHPIVSTGIILRAEHVENFSGHGNVNVIRADYVAVGGDSGGVIVTPASGIQIIAGIHVGRIGGNSYFSPVSRINTALGVTLH